MTLAATWILGEYIDVLLEGGIVDDDHTMMVSANGVRSVTLN
jgi:AP-1 complex subunit gamma-1